MTREEAQLRALYDKRYYLDHCNHPHWFLNNRAKEQARWNAVLTMLTPRPTDTILDLGCGAGTRTLAIAPMCKQALGVDFSSAAIHLAQRQAYADGITNVTFCEADVRDLVPLGSGGVHKAMAVDLVEHIGDETLIQMLKALRRVMLPGGVLAIYTPCRTHYVERLKARGWILRQEEGHIAVRTPMHLRTLLASEGWALREEFFLPSSYPVFSYAERALLRIPWLAPFAHFRICMSWVRP